MNTPIKIEISELLSLTNGNPESILPGLFSASVSHKRERPSSSEDESSSDFASPHIKREKSSKEDDNPNSTSPPIKKEKSSSEDDSSSDESCENDEKPSISITSPTAEADVKNVIPFNKQQQLISKLRLNNFLPLPKNNRKYLGMTASALRYHLQGERIFDFCQNHGLVAKRVECWCGKQMVLDTNGCQWICRHGKNGVKQTIRKGTWFENSKLSISDILLIAYMWVHEYSQISLLHECEQKPATVYDWIHHCKNVCQLALEQKTELLGGELKSVEFFEGKFNKKEGKHSTNKWVFCAIEQYSSNNTLMLIVDDKEARTVRDLLDKCIVPGTTIVGLLWCAFANLDEDDFEYLTRERSIVFYDQVKKLNMDTFEEFHSVTLRPAPGANRFNKLEYGPNFFEKIYRKYLAYAPDAYLAFLRDVALVYKPCDKRLQNSSLEDQEDS